MNVPSEMINSINMGALMSGLRERFINKYWDIRVDLQLDLRMMGYTIPINSARVPLVYLINMLNNVTTCFEILNNYSLIWERTSPVIFIQQLESDIIPRIIEIQKIFFIYNMSVIEYVAVEYHKQNPQKLGQINKRHIYLWDVLHQSTNLIPQNVLVQWEGAIILRNKIVHSNSISDDDLIFNYPGLTLQFRRNLPIEGSPLVFPILTDWIRIEFKEWILKMNAI